MKHRNIIFSFIITIFLIISGCVQSPLMKASSSGDYLVVEKLISDGANVNEPDSRGYTPLWHAIWDGNILTVEVLLNKGADVNAEGKNGYSPLLYLTETNCYGTDNIEIIKLLIKSGADINVKNHQGETVLDVALACRQSALVDDLIIAGVNLWIPAPGKARVFFIDKGLGVYIQVKAGNEKCKDLNKNKNGGVAFIDIEPGEHEILAWGKFPLLGIRSELESPIKVNAGEIFYFRVDEKEWGFWDYLGAFNMYSHHYPIKIVPVKEVEAKKEIKLILKSKELK